VQECRAEDCDGDLTPKRLLGWTCGDPECDEVYFGRAPNTCTCGNRRFVRTALFDIQMVDECTSCEREFLPGGRQDCNCDDPEIVTRAKGYSNFRMVDDDGRIRGVEPVPRRSPLFPSRSPGDHLLEERQIRRDAAWPANAAVTTGRYLLRSLADRDNPDTFTESKMLSFADSQSDMKELERNFREPEEAFFFDQLFVSSVREEADASGWGPPQTLSTMAWLRQKRYEEGPRRETNNPPNAFRIPH